MNLPKRIQIIGGKGISDTRIIDTDTGHELSGIKSVIFQHRIGEQPKAIIELVFIEFEGEAATKYAIKDPVTGELKNIRSVKFEDGSYIKTQE